MQLGDLESIQVAWDSLSGFAQDAYREIRDDVPPDDYLDTVWANVIWYLDQVIRYTAPSDTALRDEAHRLQRKIHRLKYPLQQAQRPYAGK